MNKKIIALAVAGALAAPMLAQADSHGGPTVYGKLALGLQSSEAGDDRSLDVGDDGSRFGIKGEEDLGNGLAGVYGLEFGVKGDKGQVRSEETQRKSFVGLKGGFGQVTIGAQGSAFDNTVGGALQPTNSVGTGYDGPGGRISDSIAYAGSFGAASIEASVVLNGDDAAGDVDRTDLAVGFDAGPVGVQVAYSKNEGGSLSTDDDGNESADADVDTVGVALSYSSDSFSATLGGYDQEDEKFYTLYGSFALGGNTVMLGYSTNDLDLPDTEDGDIIFGGLYHDISERTQTYLEIADSDADGTGVTLGLIHNF